MFRKSGSVKSVRDNPHTPRGRVSGIYNITAGQLERQVNVGRNASTSACNSRMHVIPVKWSSAYIGKPIFSSPSYKYSSQIQIHEFDAQQLSVSLL